MNEELKAIQALERLRRGLYGGTLSTLSERHNDAIIVSGYMVGLKEWMVEQDNEFANRPTWSYQCPVCSSISDEPTKYCSDCGERLIHESEGD